MIDSMTAAPPLPCSTRLREVLALARGIAAARGDANRTPVHVTLALLRERQNVAVDMLTVAGVPLSKLRSDLELTLGEPTKPQPDVVLPLTDGERALRRDATS